MQLLVYIFMGIAALAVGAAAYFALTFTIIESVLLSVVALCFAVIAMEHTLRARAERRMEKAIDDLSRLLATDAQAGQVLSQRINALAETNPGPRLDVLEADLSVMGTVVRQVAEAVSEFEELAEQIRAEMEIEAELEDEMPDAPVVEREPEPAVSMQALREALADNRLVFHLRTVITLPQRRAHGYDLVPRLTMEDGELVDAPDFMPMRGGQDVIRAIERAGLEEAVAMVRRARATGQPTTIYVPISRAVLSDRVTSDELVGMFDASRIVAPHIVLAMSEREWRAMNQTERAALAEIRAKGIAFALVSARTLRLDFNELATLGVTSVRVDAEQFVSEPENLTDFHTADVSAYVSRFGIELMVENVRTEQQVLTALEDGIRYALGPHIAQPGPVRAELLVRRDSQPAARASNG